MKKLLGIILLAVAIYSFLSLGREVEQAKEIEDSVRSGRELEQFVRPVTKACDNLLQLCPDVESWADSLSCLRENRDQLSGDCLEKLEGIDDIEF